MVASEIRGGRAAEGEDYPRPIYKPPNFNDTFNQSNIVVTVETDIGITGIGEGGSKDMLDQCATGLIGENPFQIERIWHTMYKAWFYPPGREKIHALGRWTSRCGTSKARRSMCPCISSWAD